MSTHLDWTELLTQQLRWHWEAHLRPRLDGLTDDEYFWEPVPGCWNLRDRTQSSAAIQAGGGELVIEFELPEPDPPPLTTIAWRLAHLIVPVLGERNASHFDGPPVDFSTARWGATAVDALEQLDAAYAIWIDAVGKLSSEALAAPVGKAEGPFADDPMAGLVLHIHREVIHHGSEITLLRDLYRNR